MLSAITCTTFREDELNSSIISRIEFTPHKGFRVVDFLLFWVRTHAKEVPPGKFHVFGLLALPCDRRILSYGVDQLYEYVHTEYVDREQWVEDPCLIFLEGIIGPCQSSLVLCYLIPGWSKQR